MKAILLMFDSLKKDWLPPYGGDIIAPNFERLAQHTVALENFYVGSMPCMPARRELHTGRYGFFHEGWSPLEPFDDSMPQILSQRGIHTHLVSDHHHYWRDGGANYHPRYSSYDHIRGQEGDPWKCDPRVPYVNHTSTDNPPPFFQTMLRQDCVNRAYMATEETHCQTLCFNAGLEFLNANQGSDNWFLQLECFDPHEPLYTFEQYKALYPSAYEGRAVDWPMMGAANQSQEYIAYVQNQYKALVSMIDHNVGRLLDHMDANNLWADTLLIVNTDHGLLLGEHDWWSKGVIPLYNEIANIPFFIWDPRVGKKNEHRSALAQNIDVAATLLDYFGAPLPPDMEGRPLRSVLEDDTPIHDTVLYGYFGAAVNITDGRYVYMRGPVQPNNAPLSEYTLIPASMGSRADVKHLQHIELHPPFRFTKGCPTLRIDKSKEDSPFSNAYRFGSRLYDLKSDPGQKSPIQDADTELRLIGDMLQRMGENDAPAEQYERLGLWEGITAQDLASQRAAFRQSFAPPFLTEYPWEAAAVNQWNTLRALLRGQDLSQPFTAFVKAQNIVAITPAVLAQFAMATLPKQQAGMALMMLNLSERLD